MKNKYHTKVPKVKLFGGKFEITQTHYEDKDNRRSSLYYFADLYQITMAYAYWKSGKVADTAVFDLFFRANPFHGEFTIFAGLEECLKFMENFRYSDSGMS